MKTLFITGAEGFTGKHLFTFLRKRGYEVVGGVRNRARKLAFEKQFGKALVCDVTDPIDVARAVAAVKPDGIVHLAGMSRPADALQDPLAAYQSIVTSWANLLDAVRRIVPRSRVLLTSSCEVYGNAGADGQPIRPETRVQPVNAFGSLKATAESIAQTFFLNYRLNFSIARPFHYIGAGLSEETFFGSVACRLATADGTTDGTAMELPDLDAQRDILHIADAVQAYTDVLEEGRPNEFYNICSGRTHTVRELVEAIARAAGRHVTFTPQAVENEGQIQRLCGDNTKLKEEFGWRSDFTWEQSIQDLVAYFRKQTAGAAA